MKKTLLLLPLAALCLCGCTKDVNEFITLEKDNVQYPKFKHENKANEAITNKINSIITVYRPGESEDKVTYKLMREDDIVSITFSGEVMAKGAAHPARVYECGSFNAKTGKILPLSRLGEINDKFLADFTKAANDELAKLETPVKLEDIYAKDELKTELEKADRFRESNVNTTCSYSTSDGLFIRLGVPHVYGDFIEVRMPGSGV